MKVQWQVKTMERAQDGRLRRFLITCWTAFPCFKTVRRFLRLGSNGTLRFAVQQQVVVEDSDALCSSPDIFNTDTYVRQAVACAASAFNACETISSVNLDALAN